MLLRQAAEQGWSAPAIHDTVAAIVRARAFQRSTRTSLLERVARWADELLRELFGPLRELPHGRQIAIGCVVALVVLVTLRIVYTMRLRDEAAGRIAVPARGAASGAGDPAAEAARLAAAGRFTEAAHALYRALLLLLARRERLRLHPSKTTGDYARELRRAGSRAHAPFRQFGQRYDRLLFGREPFDATAYAALLDEARPLLAADHPA